LWSNIYVTSLNTQIMTSFPSSHGWMYDRVYKGRSGLKPTFITGVEEFIEIACQWKET